MSKLILVDADPIVYRAGFASERTGYHVLAQTEAGDLQEAEFWPKGTPEGKSLSAGDQMKAWLEAGKLEVVDKERLVDPEPVEHCLHIVKQEITSIVHACRGKVHAKAEPIVVLSGPGNFREKLATIKPYKGNRDSLHKPVHYQAIRDYLHDRFGALVIHGREADDEVSIRSWEQWRAKRKFCLATIDKDLDQVPGLHYDYRQHVFYDIDEESAEQMFWRQALSGDVIDNIGGCYKVGAVKAEKLVAAWYKDGMSQQDIWSEVVALYEMSRKLPGCPYEVMSGEEAALENARLVYMQRAVGELWNPPGVPFGILEGGVDD